MAHSTLFVGVADYDRVCLGFAAAVLMLQSSFAQDL
jgi:hypothetical protein